LHFNLGSDLTALEVAIRGTPGVRLVVIDPLSAYLGRIDSHKNADVRWLLAPLANLAAHYGVSVLAVMHLNKGTGGRALCRATGSVAFGAMARGAFLVAADPNDSARRLLLSAKSNLAERPPGLAFRIAPVSLDGLGSVPRLAWEAEPVGLTADDVLAAEAVTGETRTRRGPDPQERGEAAEWLREALRDGPRPAEELFAEAEDDGISRGTLRRAKADLEVKAHKEGWQGRWVWRLPEEAHEEAQGLPSQKTCAPLEKPAPLWENQGARASFGTGETHEETKGAQVTESWEST
jgi:hypothetical protein